MLDRRPRVNDDEQSYARLKCLWLDTEIFHWLSLDGDVDNLLDWESDLNFLLFFSWSTLVSVRFNLDVELRTTRVEGVDWTIVRLGELIDSARTTLRLTTNRGWPVVVSSDFLEGEWGMTLRTLTLVALAPEVSVESTLSLEDSLSERRATRRRTVLFFSVGDDRAASDDTPGVAIVLGADDPSVFGSTTFSSERVAGVDVTDGETAATVGFRVSLLTKFIDAAIHTKRNEATPIAFTKSTYVEQAMTVSDEDEAANEWRSNPVLNIRLASFRKNRRCHWSSLDANRREERTLRSTSHRLLTVTWMVLLWRNGQARSWQLPWTQAGQTTFAVKAKGLCRYAHAEPYEGERRFKKRKCNSKDGLTFAQVDVRK